jgi:Biopolymer transport protein
MTPMIDIVFQLIIFFVVTLKFNKDVNPNIVLEDGKNGPTITAESLPPTTLAIEVDQRGRVSIYNSPLTDDQLLGILKGRYNRHGEFPVLIRGDMRTQHEKIRRVMDLCARSGLWKLSFVAVKEHKVTPERRK